MDALILNAEHRTASVQRITKPTPQPGEVLIRVHAIALNPVDSLYVANPLGATGRTVGSDFAGVIQESRFNSLVPGTHVAGFLQGACSINDLPGAFAKYLVCPGDLLWHVPDEMSLEEAATVSLCALTAAQGIFYRLGLETPFPYSERTTREDIFNEDEFAFFIYGASTSVGMYAAQLVRSSAKASGKRVKLIGAASRARWPTLKSEPYGYDELVDYRDDDWPEQVKTLMGDRGVNFVYDCISEGSTVKKTASLLRNGGSMAIVRSKEGGAWTADNLPIEPIYGAVWEVFGVEIQYQNLIVPASLEARAFAVAFYKWLSEGRRLAPNPVRLMPGGLEKVVPDAFALLGSGSMGDRSQERKEEYMKPLSAQKMVYRLAP